MYNIEGEWEGELLCGRLDWLTWSISDPGRISAVPNSVWWSHHPPDDETRLRSGQLLKPGRVAELTGLSVEEVLCLLARRASSLGDGDFEVALASEVYSLPHSQEGPIGSSCMAPHSGHKCPREAFVFYDVLGCKAAYIVKYGLVVARTILFPGGFHGRLYATSQSLCDAFQATLEARGYTKLPSGHLVGAEALRDYEGPVPYVDWVPYLVEVGDAWVLASNSGVGTFLECLQSTDGSSEVFGYSQSSNICCCCQEVFSSREVQDEDGCRFHGDRLYCESCFDEWFFCCPRCGEFHSLEDSVRISDIGEYWCQSCTDYNAYCCPACDEYFSSGRAGSDDTGDGQWYCDGCLEAFFKECEHCGTYYQDGLVPVDGDLYCRDCLKELEIAPCQQCGDLHLPENLTPFRRWSRVARYCDDCLPDSVECPSCGVNVLTLGDEGVCVLCSQAKKVAI